MELAVQGDTAEISPCEDLFGIRVLAYDSLRSQ